MLRKTIACFVLVVSIPMIGQGVRKSGSLSGRVFSGATPLYRAFVYVRDPVWKNDTLVPVDSNGTFRTTLRAGLYDVFVSEATYVPVCKRVEITGGQNISFSAELQLDREHLENAKLPR